MNEKENNLQSITLDATNVRLGRLASKVASLLMGKDQPSYAPEKDLARQIYLVHPEKIVFSGKKWTTKFYIHHTGYPGGVRKIALKDLFAKDPKKVISLAVAGMLPKNKLRSKRLRRLKFISSYGKE